MARGQAIYLTGNRGARKGAPKAQVAEPEAAASGTENEYLGFRVPADFRRRMRMFAAKHDMRLQQVLMEAFEALVREKGGE